MFSRVSWRSWGYFQYILSWHLLQISTRSLFFLFAFLKTIEGRQANLMCDKSYAMMDTKRSFFFFNKLVCKVGQFSKGLAQSMCLLTVEGINGVIYLMLLSCLWVLAVLLKVLRYMIHTLKDAEGWGFSPPLPATRKILSFISFHLFSHVPVQGPENDRVSSIF